MPNEKVLIAAGGTGGHIYPALAMADAFKAAKPDVVVEFVGTAHGLENKLVPAKGYKVHHLPIGRLNNNVPFTERLKTVVQLPFAFIKSFLLLRKVKPAFVLGVGGHATGPLLLAAALCRYRTAIWEPNAMPGLANRWLARFVDECWVVFEDAKTFLKNRNSHNAGMPVRKEIEAPPPPTVQKGQRFRVLVFGGSQGARFFADSVPPAIALLGEDLRARLVITQQARPEDVERVRAAYAACRISAEIAPFFQDLPARMAATHLVIGRAGGSSVAELGVIGRPSILVPLPHAVDNDQLKNATTLSLAGGAWLIEQRDLTPERLADEIARLASEPHRLVAAATVAKAVGRPDAVERLADLVIELMQRPESPP